jgi:hypothetical protein
MAMKCALNLCFKTLAANCTAVAFTSSRYLNELRRGLNVPSLSKSKRTMAALHQCWNLMTLNECQCDGEWLLQGGQYYSYDRRQVESGFLSGLSGGFQMSAGPAGFSGRPGGFSWRPTGCSGRTKPKQKILFERFCTAFTKKVSKVRNINHMQLNHCSPAIAVFHPSTRQRLMQADAGCLNHVQAGWLLTQAGPPLVQAFRMEARPGRLGTLNRISC